MTLDVNAAKSAGWSDEEIQKFEASRQSKSPSFDVGSAKEAGWKDEEIQEFLNKGASKNPSFLNTLKEHWPQALASGGISLAEMALGSAGISPGGEPTPIVKQAVQDIRGGLVPREGWTPAENKPPENADKVQMGEGLREMAGVRDLPSEDQQNLALLEQIIPIAAMIAPAAVKGLTGIKAKLLGAAKSEISSIPSSIRPVAPEQAVPKNMGAPPPEPPPPPPGAGSAPIEASEIVPTGKITTSPEYLRSDYELAQDVKSKLSPLYQESVHPESVKVGKTVQNLLKPLEEDLKQISPERIKDFPLIGRETARTVQRVAAQEYQRVNESWERARNFASDTIAARPGLVENLRTMIDELPAPQAGGASKTKSFAQDLYNSITRFRGKRRPREAIPLSNVALIDAIVNARKNGYKYDFHGGENSHFINRFIKAVEEELLATAGPEERRALEAARQAYSDWATKYKNSLIKPFRNERISNPVALHQKAMQPDTFNLLNSILIEDSSGRGKTTASLLKRNLIENSLQKYLLNPETINPLKLESDLGKLSSILSEPQRASISQKLIKLNHEAINAPKGKVAPGANKFLSMNEAKLMSHLDNISGLKELEQELSGQPGGKRLYDIIAKTKGIDLLFGGQMDIPAKAARIQKQLNDRNGAHYLRETLGENVVNELNELVEKNKLEESLSKIEENKEISGIIKNPEVLLKSGDIVISALKGNIFAAIKKAHALYKHIGKIRSPEAAGSETSYDIK
jgi:hypothetical protein